MFEIGIIYFLVILIANSLGAISGMGGGVLIKPIFDMVGQDSVAAISFYSAIAVFTMSVVATIKQSKAGSKINWQFIAWIAGGSIFGGILGSNLLTMLLKVLANEDSVLLIQIIITVCTILFAFLNTRLQWQPWNLKGWYWYFVCGLILGLFASFLGIGGGPINVALLTLMFGIPLKEATVYSICTILFSQGSKLINIVMVLGIGNVNLSRLWFIIPAAILGGYFGASMSNFLTTKYVELVFQSMLLIVILINLYNGIKIFI